MTNLVSKCHLQVRLVTNSDVVSNGQAYLVTN